VWHNTHPARDAKLGSKAMHQPHFSHLGEMRPKKGSIPRGITIIYIERGGGVRSIYDSIVPKWVGGQNILVAFF